MSPVSSHTFITSFLLTQVQSFLRLSPLYLFSSVCHYYSPTLFLSVSLPSHPTIVPLCPIDDKTSLSPMCHETQYMLYHAE